MWLASPTPYPSLLTNTCPLPSSVSELHPLFTASLAFLPNSWSWWWLILSSRITDMLYTMPHMKFMLAALWHLSSKCSEDFIWWPRGKLDGLQFYSRQHKISQLAWPLLGGSQIPRSQGILLASMSIASQAFFRETWLNFPTNLLLAHMALQHRPLSALSLHSLGIFLFFWRRTDHSLGWIETKKAAVRKISWVFLALVKLYKIAKS